VTFNDRLIGELSVDVVPTSYLEWWAIKPVQE